MATFSLDKSIYERYRHKFSVTKTKTILIQFLLTMKFGHFKTKVGAYSGNFF